MASKKSHEVAPENSTGGSLASSVLSFRQLGRDSGIIITGYAK
jgi:hypothetical protein